MVRVLLVDDETHFRDSTAALLEHRGYECVTAADAKIATRVLEDEVFDVVITDIQMDGNRDFEFVRTLAGLDPCPVVVVLTAYPTLDSAIESVGLPVYSYLLKPQPIDDLVAGIEEGRKAAARTAVVPPLDADLSALTQREREVVEMLANGYRVSNIAQRLFISPHTVRNHLKAIFAKLEVGSQPELLDKLRPQQPAD